MTEISESEAMRNVKYLLLRIVSRICKQPREDTPPNAIWTADDDSVMVSINKFIVEHRTKHTVHQFTAAVCQNICRRALTGQAFIEVMETIW